MTASASAQTLTITGTNFAACAIVQAGYAGASATNLTVTARSTTQITASIVTGLVTRAWSIVVTNPNGQSSFAASLLVNAPAPPPAISDLSPNPITGSNGSQVLTINGSGCQSGAALTVTYPADRSRLSPEARSHSSIAARFWPW
jgi:hypothetical protein